MQKGFVVLAFLSAAVVAVACSSSDESTFAETELPEPDGGTPISPLVPDASLDASDSGPASCPPAIPDAFAPTWKAPVKQAACSDEDLAGYWAACLEDASQTDKCAAWTKDHADCTACVEPADGSGPIQWHQNRMYYTLNVAGCLDLQHDDADNDGCGEAYNAAVQCGRESCESCFAVGGTFDQFRDCQREVQTKGVCKSYETVQGTECAGIKESGEPTLSCFKDSAETSEVFFTRVEGFFCGE